MNTDRFDVRHAQDAPNINALWCGLILEELGRLGMRDIVVCPGSRNTPLVAALTRAEGLRVTPVIDERAAGFFALGCTKAGRPAAVVTTSGTAVMNLIPAVTEARQTGLPLLVLSADRPQELRACGSNQTIDQLGPLAPLVKWQHDLPAPDDRLPARLALTAVDEAVRRAMTEPRGPVQLNCAFREPLAPRAERWDADCLAGLESWRADSAPFVREEPAQPRAELTSLIDRIGAAQRGLLVVGNTADGSAVRKLADQLRWPVIADAASNLRTGGAPQTLIRHATLLRDLPTPDFVLQFGSRPVSRKIEAWLEECGCERVLVDPAAGRRNPGHARMERRREPVATVATALAAEVMAAPPGPWLQTWLDADTRAAETLAAVLAEAAELTEAQVARDVAAAPLRLFAGNSMPIRHLGIFAAGDSPHGGIDSSRGASGIDGVVATACGTACGAGEPLVLLIGDLSLLHDLSSLLLARNSRQKVVVVVINNGGGGIFDHLPVAAFPEVQSPWCDGTHDLELAGVADHFGLPTWRCATREEWATAWTEAQAGTDSCLIEAICRRESHGELMREVRRRLDGDQE